MKFFGLIRSQKGDMTLTELVGLCLAALILFMVFKPIVSFAAHLLDVRSPTEKSFDVLTDEINSMLQSESKFEQKQAIPITIEKDYSIIGFDSDYNPVAAIGDTDNYFDWDYFKYSDKLYGDLIGKKLDNPKINRPEACSNRACICLVHVKKGVIKCTTFGENVVLSAPPFVDPYTNNLDDSWKWFKSLFGKDPLVYPMQNTGKARVTNNGFVQQLSKKNYTEEWYKWYGYMYLSSELKYSNAQGTTISWNVRNVYVERLLESGTNYILIIPGDSQTIGTIGASTLGSQLINGRKKLIEDIFSGEKAKIVKIISDLSKKDKLTDEEYKTLYTNCLKYRTDYPSFPVPTGCSKISRCSDVVCSGSSCKGSISESSCKSVNVPCICTTKTSIDVCSDTKKYCYHESGCTAEAIPSQLDCGWETLNI